MLPTPTTSHVPYSLVYEPAEDSFLLLDTLSSPSQTPFLSSLFPPATTPPPLILEIGPGSGVVLAFLTAHALPIFSRSDILTLGIDINSFACSSTTTTSLLAASSHPTTSGHFLGCLQGDLTGCLRSKQVDVLVFNPPYVPTEELPTLPATLREGGKEKGGKVTFEDESKLLELSYAGGKDGMETTDRVIDSLGEVLSDRGVAYLLLCAGNKPEEVKQRIRGMGNAGEGRQWKAETVGTSGRQAGWEKLQIVRIWRE
ncbi:methyltransferase domain-containing protein [Apiosordaria backusii]|uniref:Methyltransferase domain-containing protein n=1 Tax=Apiosordaria backusii TaxID=314023 RepID=A0AA40DZL1_9PEZI|nr:methyltransferase domain-containing protein [Apiosordaria backusii]